MAPSEQAELPRGKCRRAADLHGDLRPDDANTRDIERIIARGRADTPLVLNRRKRRSPAALAIFAGALNLCITTALTLRDK